MLFLHKKSSNLVFCILLNTFPMALVTVIPLWLLRSVISLALWIVVIYPSAYILGYLPDEIHTLNILLRLGIRIDCPFFSMLVEILSRPVDLFNLSVASVLEISLSLIGKSSSLKFVEFSNFDNFCFNSFSRSVNLSSISLIFLKWDTQADECNKSKGRKQDSQTRLARRCH